MSTSTRAPCTCAPGHVCTPCQEWDLAQPGRVPVSRAAYKQAYDQRRYALHRAERLAAFRVYRQTHPRARAPQAQEEPMARSRSILLPVSLDLQVRAIAEREGVRVSDQIVQWIEEGVARDQAPAEVVLPPADVLPRGRREQPGSWGR